MRLSNSILNKCPLFRRDTTLSNLQWIARNIKLSNTERKEIIQAIKEKRAKLYNQEYILKIN